MASGAGELRFFAAATKGLLTPGESKGTEAFRALERAADDALLRSERPEPLAEGKQQASPRGGGGGGGAAGAGAAEEEAKVRAENDAFRAHEEQNQAKEKEEEEEPPEKNVAAGQDGTRNPAAASTTAAAAESAVAGGGGVGGGERRLGVASAGSSRGRQNGGARVASSGLSASAPLAAVGLFDVDPEITPTEAVQRAIAAALAKLQAEQHPNEGAAASPAARILGGLPPPPTERAWKLAKSHKLPLPKLLEEKQSFARATAAVAAESESARGKRERALREWKDSKEGKKLRKELQKLEETLLARVSTFRRSRERDLEERLRHLRFFQTALKAGRAEEGVECPLCLDAVPPSRRMIFPCAHVGCDECWPRQAHGGDGTGRVASCPVCRFVLRPAGAGGRRGLGEKQEQIAIPLGSG